MSPFAFGAEPAIWLQAPHNTRSDRWPRPRRRPPIRPRTQAVRDRRPDRPVCSAALRRVPPPAWAGPGSPDVPSRSRITSATERPPAIFPMGTSRSGADVRAYGRPVRMRGCRPRTTPSEQPAVPKPDIDGRRPASSRRIAPSGTNRPGRAGCARSGAMARTADPAAHMTCSDNCKDGFNFSCGRGLFALTQRTKYGNEHDEAEKHDIGFLEPGEDTAESLRLPE